MKAEAPGRTGSPRVPDPRGRITAVVVAWNEQREIGRTLAALKGVHGVGSIVVVDDGSTDSTASVARAAGADVLSAPSNLGKGGALEWALERLCLAEVILLLDADLGQTASEAGSLLEAVESGGADLAVGRLPALAGGGFGMVKRTARAMVRMWGGPRMEAPLSGQRAVSRPCLEALRPLAGGFGLETAMTIDAARLGFVIEEVPVAMMHRSTGRGLAGFSHRAAQGLDILRAALPRLAGLR